ncbi:MAG: EAL domain-containing protein [Burkholderiales bacterium]|nr:EAL domain-containing protein [Burkholderiales bacterium]
MSTQAPNTKPPVSTLPATRPAAERRASRSKADASLERRVRAAQYGDLMQGLPFLLGAMLVLAAILAAVSPGAISDMLLMGWLVSLATLSLLGLQTWWRWRRADKPRRVASTEMRRLIGLAGITGALWGCVPALMFIRAGAPQQQLLAVMLFGLLGAGTFTLAGIPAAALAYAATLSLGTFVALATSPGSIHLYTLLGWVVFAGIAAVSVRSHARDLRARVAAESRNENQQQLIGLLLRDFEENGSDVIWEIDASGHLTQPSKRLAEALAMGRKELEALTITDLIEKLQHGLPDGELDSAQQFKQRLTAGQPFRDVLLPLMLTGQPHCWSMTAKPIVDDRGATDGWRGVARDITQSQGADRRLAMTAQYDTLTGLMNRAQFRVQLEQAMNSSPSSDERDSRRGAVLCLDLDKFKSINDGFGHGTGDALLLQVAQRLKAAVSKIDLVARLGGDQFAVLLRHQSDKAEVHAAAQRIVDGLKPPCEAKGASVTLRASLGVARFPLDGTSVDELLQHADLALYDAKSRGDGQLCFFEASMGEQVRRRQVLERDLRSAIDNKQLALHFQPKVDLASWRLLGFEALLRWDHPVHGAIPPAEFIPVAEDSGLILPLGEWALGEACRQAASWPANLQVAVNISPVQVLTQNLPTIVKQTLKSTRLAAKRLEIEITESVFINEAAGTVDRLHALRKLGVTIALDDFGAGYSSLAYLRRFPFDTLKIDRAFVRELLVSQDARSVVRNILALARSLRMSTVAEGVEEPAQLKMLAGEGCSAIQGFFVAKPMPADEVQAFVAGWREDKRPAIRQARSKAEATADTNIEAPDTLPA